MSKNTNIVWVLTTFLYCWIISSCDLVDPDFKSQYEIFRQSIKKGEMANVERMCTETGFQVLQRHFGDTTTHQLYQEAMYRVFIEHFKDSKYDQYNDSTMYVLSAKPDRFRPIATLEFIKRNSRWYLHDYMPGR